MKIATWNVNSIKARKERLVAWLAANQPDVLCLQELKLEPSAFPHDELRELGYHAAVHAQKTYNGVAIVARRPLLDVEVGLGDGVDDPQARLIAATIDGIRVIVSGGKGADRMLRVFNANRDLTVVVRAIADATEAAAISA